MVNVSAVRGSRLGSVSLGETDYGERAPRFFVSYWCLNGHEVRPSFSAAAVDEDIPDEWECPKCGFPAGQDPANPPAPSRVEPYKTHLAYVKERRSDVEAREILDEALHALRSRRGRK
ncbi:RNA polymerase-binding protein RbpA [Timonella sp. A28]|uniref:RNA polymerase-binding protein RbpA n=1 Tax=Timonella sp. A28 TaxID=3442640 RepID=UPI003EBF2015